MKKQGTYINFLLGILMLVANLLPALHTPEHFSSLDSEKILPTLELAENLSKPALDCNLCDFTFSSAGEPFIFSYELNLPPYFFEQNISKAEIVHLFSQSIFSLRAPPAATA